MNQKLVLKCQCLYFMAVLSLKRRLAQSESFAL